MCNALLIHMRCASHTTRTLLSTWWNIWYIKYDRLLHNTSVVYWTSSQRCLCNHRATLHSSNDKPPPLRCFVHNDSMRESSSTAEKTRAVVKARPAISCLISLLPVPRCPCVCFAPLFYFSEAVIFSCLLNAVSCLTHFAMSTRALSPSVTATKTMNKCVPVLYVAHSDWTHVHAFWTILHIIPASMTNWQARSNQSE